MIGSLILKSDLSLNKVSVPFGFIYHLINCISHLAEDFNFYTLRSPIVRVLFGAVPLPILTP
ncbi:MAG TPA: hypothetical protein IGS53_11515 [Leptolyngbyaceae cyanobacterium M33_DOE_097]|uniref:Uncharacterized protein n=1 Tax=Oscillatoriales cyanobacterium SpSt-418 TaxID=2282169 RepID=A0A7C3KFR3_9CYAN|nr:hypothetical protein [Leptolyngbyaceae cyanobacterium M33_DOE_097]